MATNNLSERVSLEILHHKHAVEYYKAIIPALVASCFSYVVFALVIQLGLGSTWNLSAYEYSGVFDFAYAVLFAVVATAVGWGFIYCTKFFKSLFEKRRLPIYIKTLIGGLLLGVISFYLPLTRYFGHHEINLLLTENLSLKLLVAILVFKIIAIAVTVTSGWRGGFIIPLFFVGATLGLIIHQLFLLATLTGFGYFIPILFASLTGYFLSPRIPFISSQMEKEPVQTSSEI